MKKKWSLKRVYSTSFFLMIVIPVLLIFGTALGILNVLMKNSAISNIRSAQSSMKEMLDTEIKDVSLQLSHFVYNNDGDFMRIVAGTDTDQVRQRYDYQYELDDAFETALAPKQDILSMVFYMKSGRATYLKEELKKSYEEISDSGWYRDAMDRKNVVSVGGYDGGIQQLTFSRQSKTTFILAAGLSPNLALDRSGKIEMAALFCRSDIGKLIAEQEETRIGKTLLVNEQKEIIYRGNTGDEENWYLAQLDTLEEGVYRRRVQKFENPKRSADYTFVVLPVSPVGWRIVSMIPTRQLTADFDRIVGILLLVVFVLYMLFYIFSRYFLQNILDPVHKVVEGMAEVQSGNLDVHLEPEGQQEIRQMTHSFNRMVRRIRELITENREVQEKKHQAEIQALQSQINPHFLVNTLNSIRFMAQVSKFEGIRKMAEALMKIVSCSFRSNISFYSLREELDVLDSYLYLMKIRYSEGFEVELAVDDSCLDALVPRLILQPLVENSIVHGFTGEEMGILKITVGQEENRIRISVYDNGQGMTEEKISSILRFGQKQETEHNSIGLENVVTRLKLNFGDDAGIEIHSELEEFTEVLVWFPTVREKKNEKGIDC